MRTLRAKLFLSVGTILLIVAVLSYLVPKYFVKKDITTASNHLNDVFTSIHTKVLTVAKSWVLDRFIQKAAQLDGVAQLIKVDQEDVWNLASSIIGSDPEIAFVQVRNAKGEIAQLAPVSGHLMTPAWAKDDQQKLWIKMPGAQEIYLATPLHTDREWNTFLLHSTNSPNIKESSFTPFQPHIESTLLKDDPEEMYEALRLKETLLLRKMEMIKELVPWRQTAQGILKVEAAFKKGVALMTAPVFITTPLLNKDKTSLQDPFLLFRKEANDVDLMEWAPTGQQAISVAVGFSLSAVCKEIAITTQKPILFSDHQQLLQGFDRYGHPLSLDSISRTGERVLWNKKDFFANDVQIGPITLSMLTPESEVNAVTHFLTPLQNSLINKISLNIFIVAFVLLLIALILLARISKQITQPIAQLAVASEEIGAGKYEDLVLPPSEKRHDEVAILTHSFQKMVLSLRDRERIRGVLNKVVSKEIATKILTGEVELGGEERTLTLLFSDIRGFTPLSETLSPRALIGLLNTYMTRMCRIIDETHGVVDKFVGDEIMALYGAPIDLAHHAEKAIYAAILMVKDLMKWNEERGTEAPQIKTGFGIHTGVAFSGNMGAENRLNYTVVGSNVNLAARLCAAALPMQILISEQTYQSLEDPKKFNMKKLTPIPLKGIDQPVPIYEICY